MWLGVSNSVAQIGVVLSLALTGVSFFGKRRLINKSAQRDFNLNY
jgi:hypothetical protein